MNTGNRKDDEHFGQAAAFLLFGIGCGLCLDLSAKQLLLDYPLEQFVFLRSAIGLTLFLVILRWQGGLAALKTRRYGLHLMRAGLSCIAMFGFFFGLGRMPLVNALTLAFTAPLIVTALAGPLLGDEVGWRRWAAVLAGFAGVLIVLRPGTGLFSYASLAVLAAAAAYAGLALTARMLDDTESTYAMAIYAIAGPMAVSTFTLPAELPSPTAAAWLLFATAGLCSVGAWVGIVGGYRRASPVKLAPFEYLALIGGAVFGYLFWDEVPDRYVVIGSAIIIASGIYIAFRESGASLSARTLRAFTLGSAAVVARRFRRPPPPGS